MSEAQKKAEAATKEAGSATVPEVTGADKAAAEAAAAAAAGSGSEAVKKNADGTLTVKEDWYNSQSADLKEYKAKAKAANERLTALETRLQTYDEKEKTARETKLKEAGEHEKIIADRDEEIKKMKDAQQDQRIDFALTTGALTAGIKKPDYVSLIDRASVKFDPETGVVTGVETAVTAFKEANADLFGSPKGPGITVDTGKPGGDVGKLTFTDLMKDGKKAQQLKRENPALYKKLKDEHYAAK